jgi:hypothetical protein
MVGATRCDNEERAVASETELRKRTAETRTAVRHDVETRHDPVLASGRVMTHHAFDGPDVNAARLPAGHFRHSQPGIKQDVGIQVSIEAIARPHLRFAVRLGRPVRMARALPACRALRRADLALRLLRSGGSTPPFAAGSSASGVVSICVKSRSQPSI